MCHHVFEFIPTTFMYHPRILFARRMMQIWYSWKGGREGEFLRNALFHYPMRLPQRKPSELSLKSSEPKLKKSRRRPTMTRHGACLRNTLILAPRYAVCSLLRSPVHHYPQTHKYTCKHLSSNKGICLYSFRVRFYVFHG
jgi:hypothetical protein